MAVTTIRDLINRAYRMAGGLRDQRGPADATDYRLALADVQALTLALPGMSHWTDVDTAVNYTAGPNERVRVTVDAEVIVTVPSTVSSAPTLLTCCGQTTIVCSGHPDRAPRDGERVQVTDEFSDNRTTYYFRSDIAQWTRADSLTLDSESPLNADMDLYFAALIAMVLATADGQDVPQTTAILAGDARSRMRARYGQRQGVAVDLPLLRTSSNRGYYR